MARPEQKEEWIKNFKISRLDQLARLSEIISEVSPRLTQTVRTIDYEFDPGNKKPQLIKVDGKMMVLLYTSLKSLHEDVSTNLVYQNREGKRENDPGWKEKADKVLEDSKANDISNKSTAS